MDQKPARKIMTSRRVVLGAGLGIAVGGVFGVSSIIQAQQNPQRTSEPAETVIRNANITTLNPDMPQATTLAIRNGQIIAVGQESDIQSFTGPDTRIIDAGGRRLIPGLNDSHMHLVSYGWVCQEFGVNGSTCRAGAWQEVSRFVGNTGGCGRTARRD